MDKIIKKQQQNRKFILRLNEILFWLSYSIEAGITEPVQTAPEEPETVKVSKAHTLTLKLANTKSFSLP